MANALTRAVGRAPKWAWYVAGGIGLGGAAIQLYRQRDARTEKLNADVEAGGEAEGTVGLAPSPQPGIVVPPVIIPQNQNDPLAGVLPLQDLYLSTIGQVVSGWQDIAAGWQNVYTPVISHDETLIDRLAGMIPSAPEIAAIATAGPAPTPYTPPPVVAAPPPPPPPPPPVCPGSFPQGGYPNCYRTEYDNRTRDNGKSGSARRVWCNRVTIHRYMDGHSVVLPSEDKLRDGAC